MGKPNIIEAGRIITTYAEPVDANDDAHLYQFALLVEFDNADDCRAALISGNVGQCTVFGQVP